MIITIPNIFLNDLFFPIIDSGLWTIVATSADGKSTTAAFFLSIFASQDELKEEGFNLYSIYLMNSLTSCLLRLKIKL